MLAAGTLTQHRKFTKSVVRSKHDRTNLIQHDWAGYTSSNRSDLHKRFCAGRRLSMAMVALLREPFGLPELPAQNWPAVFLPFCIR